MGSFSAGVDAWVAEKKEYVTAVFRLSAQNVVQKCQERVPVDTGFTRATAQVSKTDMPRIDPTADNNEKHTYTYDPAPIVALINGLEVGESLFFGYTSAYAPRLEFEGYSRQAPAGFVRLTAQEWPAIVAESIAALKQRLGG